jgi:hypothetical protein
MATDQLIRQLKKLREVEPSKNWVVFSKQRIFAGEPETEKRSFTSIFPFFQYKLALAPIISVFVVIGLFGFAQQTRPGDFLFSVKKMTESVQVGLSSPTEKSATSLKLANKRLEELGRIAEANQTQNLNVAVKEFQTNVEQAAKSLAGLEADGSDSTSLKEIMAETQKLTENKERIEEVLGAKIGDTEGLSNALTQLEKQTAAYLIADLEKRTLSETDGLLLGQAKDDFNSGNYATSLEKIWLLSNK